METYTVDTSNSAHYRHGILRVKWGKTLLGSELYQRYNTVLEQAAQGNQCRIWLLDISERTQLVLADDLWLQKDFVLRATQLLNGPVFVAYLVAPQLLAKIEHVSASMTRTWAAEHNFYCAFFENAGQAYSWLRDQQELALANGRAECDAQSA
ncbi:MAG: hypothetical protein ACRYFX_30545 [Janthinobacterium lividum]